MADVSGWLKFEVADGTIASRLAPTGSGGCRKFASLYKSLWEPGLPAMRPAHPTCVMPDEPPSRASSLPQVLRWAEYFCYCINSCGSEPARENLPGQRTRPGAAHLCTSDPVVRANYGKPQAGIGNRGYKDLSGIYGPVASRPVSWAAHLHSRIRLPILLKPVLSSRSPVFWRTLNLTVDAINQLRPEHRWEASDIAQ